MILLLIQWQTRLLKRHSLFPGHQVSMLHRVLWTGLRLAPVLTLLQGGGGGFYHVWDWTPGPPICTCPDTVTSAVVTNQQLNDYLQHFSWVIFECNYLLNIYSNAVTFPICYYVFCAGCWGSNKELLGIFPAQNEMTLSGRKYLIRCRWLCKRI